MVKEIKYTTVSRVLDNLLDHPMLTDLTLEQVVRHTIRFIGINGFPKLYEDKVCHVDIKDFRGLLPCDLISIIQVKDDRSKLCLRSMTDTFATGMEPEERRPVDDSPEYYTPYIPPMPLHHGELTFKTQGSVLFTSFPEGSVEIAYKAIPVDEDGFPLLIDNENYLAALEAYIKVRVFTVKFDQGKIASGVLDNAKQEYAWRAGQLNSEMVMPSMSEMESITRMWNTMIPQVRQFDRGFKHLGNREYIRKH